ncbi:MAG TPA: hypothetical protein VMM15_07035 [Bradyrhizobium sp.]|nr:hypothetical protein [Bradyrhizobium sp.]
MIRCVALAGCVAASLVAFHDKARADGASTAGGTVADQCRQQSIALKQDWEAKAQPIREASQSKASPETACKLITSFEEAEIRLINFMQANSVKCQIPGEVIEKMKATHLTTEGLKQKTCGKTL